MDEVDEVDEVKKRKGIEGEVEGIEGVEEANSKLMKRQITYKPALQKYDDCGIYAITNAFMRKIVLLLGWRSDQRMDWDETILDICSKYDPSSQYVHTSTEYQYCILYTYIQRLLRKNFGSCGIDAEPSIREFCHAFNTLMSGPITPESINIELIDTSVDREQQITYIGELEKRISELQTKLTSERTEDIVEGKIEIHKDELRNTIRRLRELEHEYANIGTLLQILSTIKGILGNQEFSVSLNVLNGPFETPPVPAVPGVPTNIPDISTVKGKFLQGNYGIMSLEFNNIFSNRFISINLEANVTSNRIFNRLEGLSRQQILSRQEGVNDEISTELYKYFDLPSGLKNKNKYEGPITLFDTFCSLLDVREANPNLGHAVIIKDIFWCDLEQENGLGVYYAIIKNSWGLKWGINGYLIVPLTIFAYAGVFMFDLVPKEANPALSSIQRSPKLRVGPNWADIAVINKTKTRPPRPPGPTRLNGGKRRRRTIKKRRRITRKKNYRKKHRKSNRNRRR